MAEETKYVYSNGVDTIGYTAVELMNGLKGVDLRPYMSSRDIFLSWAGQLVTSDSSMKFAYQLRPLRRLEKIGQDDWTLINLVDLKGQKLPGFEGEDKAIEIMGEFGMPGDSHILMHYGQDTLEMLKDFDDFQEDDWQKAFDKAIEKAPAKAKSGEDLEMPRITADEVSQVVYEPERTTGFTQNQLNQKITQAKQILKNEYVQDRVSQQAIQFLDNSKVPVEKRWDLADRIMDVYQKNQEHTNNVKFDSETKYIFDGGNTPVNPVGFTKDRLAEWAALNEFGAPTLTEQVKAYARFSHRRFSYRLNPLVRTEKVYETPGILINVVDLQNNPEIPGYRNADKAIEITGYEFLPSHNRVHLLMPYSKETLDSLRDFRDLQTPEFDQAMNRLAKKVPSKVERGWAYLPLMSDKQIKEITYQKAPVNVQKLSPNSVPKKKDRSR